ncbi:hypothetical protein [Rhodococcus sp. NPDC058514]|uniref:hypothetical protein n=1 Tax=Rhodococcus sp. NPDC058514 TaxID=3346532 RepID=UPI00364C0F8A
MNTAQHILGRRPVLDESTMRVLPEPHERRRGRIAGIAGIAQFLVLLALLGAFALWAGRVASVEVSAPAGGSGVETVAPGSLGSQHLDPETGALQLDLTPHTPAELPGFGSLEAGGFEVQHSFPSAVI